MLLQLIFLVHVVLSTANPFQKYPYVFLLDIGNEELEKVNTEQIRIAVPGGSLAIRYPAIGNANIISHVRVTGIDFGTDLKANILEGGPGYNYVVLLFVGNKGVEYDAVISVQMLPNDLEINNSIEDSGLEEADAVGTNIEDNNDSSEDFNDSEAKYSENIAEAQPSSKVYNYAESHVSNSEYSDKNGPLSDKDIHIPYKEDEKVKYEKNEENANPKYSESIEEYEKKDAPIAEKYSANEVEEPDESNYEKVVIDDNLYEKYKELRPHLYSNVKVYPQSVYENKEQNESYDEDPVEFEQMFNDEEVHDDSEKYRDRNNNFDSDGNFAVAS